MQSGFFVWKFVQHVKCKCCGGSTKDGSHLLLEIDHIIPVSKGGLTEFSNLQTLFWRCNRKKSDNLVDKSIGPDQSFSALNYSEISSSRSFAIFL